MKKRFWLFIPLAILSLASCTQKTKTEDESSIGTSASDNLTLYSSLLDEVDTKALEASTADYYKTNFSYSVSYLSGRTDYNLVSMKRTCNIRNDSLYIIKSTDYQSGSSMSQTSDTIYMKENDDVYSYNFQGNVTTIDTTEVLPLYEVTKEENFSINDVYGFSQSVLRGQAFDGTNGTIKKENNAYTIQMSYADVKDESLVSFIYNLGYFSNMLNYVKEDELMINFIYTIIDAGYSLDYGFSYSTDDTTITATVNLGMEKTDGFAITDFSDTSKYLTTYPQALTDVKTVSKVNEEVGGRYAGYSLFKFYLEPGNYGLVSNGEAVSYKNYNIYTEASAKLSKSTISLGSISLSTNYFTVEEAGYYYIYIQISTTLPSFKLVDVTYQTYASTDNVKQLDNTNEGALEGIFDYEVYQFTVESNVKVTITNNSSNNLCLIVPVTSFFTSYATIGIEANASQSFSVRAGTYYLIVSPYYAKESLNYSFTITSESSF